MNKEIKTILEKTHRKSFFINTKIGSDSVHNLFSSNPTRLDRNGTRQPIVILQVMVTPTNQVVAEVVYEKDYLKEDC